jgi:ATP-dependent helicase/nuclease subunit A
MFDAAGATRAEGEVLARWLKEDLLNCPSVKPGHVALLFRKLTQADAYLDALRRYGIPYVIEGEKHFYRRQEVIDLVNVLRVLDHPHDSVALAGLLRSPIGGLTDRDLYDLRSADFFDYLRQKPLDSWTHARADAVRRLYGQLAQLHHEIGALPLAEAIQLVFDRLPILDLAAASLHGEQAVANLLKVKQTAAALCDRPHLTLSAFVDLLVSRLEDQPDEAESPLAEESVEAVQVLTIHKAKGLEFPVVILPGLHQGTGRERALPNVVYDWSSGTYGLSLGDRYSFGSVMIREKLTLREQAERRRVLYVGMTRAKELLLLSGGSTARSVGENVLELLQDIGEGEIGAESTQALTIGGSLIPHQVVKAPDRKRPRRTLTTATGSSAVDPASIAVLWNERTAHWTTARETPVQLTATGLVAGPAPGPRPSSITRDDRESSRLAGVLAHRLLEQWNFGAAPDGLLKEIAPTVRRGLSPEEERWGPSIIASLNELFTVFVRSESYARLRTATILGREVPFVMPWGEQQLMEGIIDVIYRLDGRIWIADYKTDRVAGSEVHMRTNQYMQQAEIYRAAASRSLDGTAVSFHFLFLRSGVSVEI